MKLEKYLMNLAIIFEVINKDSKTDFIPKKVVLGNYDKERRVFTDIDGIEYAHIVTKPLGYGFAYRTEVSNIKKNYPGWPLEVIKRILLLQEKKNKYILCATDEDVNIVGYRSKTDKNNETTYNMLLDADSIIYYYENRAEVLEELFENVFNAEFLFEGSQPSDDKAKTDFIRAEVMSKIDFAKLYQELKAEVIGQDGPIKQILTAMWKQYSGFSDDKSRNIFINGNTGVGKTEIFRVLAKNLGVPICVENATQFTGSGYVGRSVDSMLVDLVKKCNGDVKKAENGILIIDEIDKLSEPKNASAQVNHGDVQNELLKIIEDGTYYIKLGEQEKEIAFNTSNLLVVAMGSFSRIEIEEKTPIGFNQSSRKKKTYQDLTREDFIKNGMLPDLIGRFPVIVQMNDLTEEDYFNILSCPKSALKLNEDLLAKKGIKLVINDEAKREIARRASKEKYGARSLDTIIEGILDSAFFEIAIDNQDYSEVVVTGETLKGNKPYTLTRRQEK